LRPGSNNKTKRFEFTPETTVRNVLVAQEGWKTVPNTWPSDSEAPVTELLCVRGTAHDLSVEERSRRRWLVFQQDSALLTEPRKQLHY